MRILAASALVVLAAFGTSVQAEDEPQGAIGVQLKLDDGKIVVQGTIENSPAAKAGFKADDVILKVNEFKVKAGAEQEDLQETVKEMVKHKPGEKMKLTIKRGDKEMTIEVVVGKRSDIFKKDE